jgi:hypothetical protein
MRLIFKSKQFSYAGNFEKLRWGKENDEENEERERLEIRIFFIKSLAKKVTKHTANTSK